MKWKLEQRKLTDLKPFDKNPRTLTKKGMADLKKSIDKFGLAEPIIIQPDGTIIGGHARLEVLKQKGTINVDVYVPEKALNEQEYKELNIRLNKNIAGEFNFEILATDFEMGELIEWGFDEGELTGYFEDDAVEDDFVIPDKIETDIKLGDLFQIGEHRLLCGDATKKEDVERLMDGKQADCLLIDPPYGIDVVKNAKIGGGGIFGGKKNIGKLGYKAIKANTYMKVEGDDKPFLPEQYLDIAPISIIFGSNYFASKLPESKAWFCWDKIDGLEGVTKNYSDFELGWTNTKKPARIFRHRWHGMIKGSEHGQARLHPTQKPIILLVDLIKYYAEKASIIVDLFAGSGSTGVACEQLNRNAYLCEIEPIYVQIIINRMLKLNPNITVQKIK